MRPPAALESVGLGGDGDEWAAVGRIEAAFGVTLDVRDAPGWLTAGDLYASLLAVLPSGQRDGDATWLRFAASLSAETGVDAGRVAPVTRLLAVPLWEQGKRWLRRVVRRGWPT